MRRKLIWTIFFSVLTFNLSLIGQTKVDQYFDFYLIPEEMAIVVNSSRSGIPIVIDEVELFTNLSGSMVKGSYRISNSGPKPIRSVEIAVIDRRFFQLSSAGMSARYEDFVDFKSLSPTKRDLVSGMSIRYNNELDRSKRLPSEIVTRIKSQQSKVMTKFVVALVVTKIEFFDGTIADFTTDADDIELMMSSSHDL